MGLTIKKPGVQSPGGTPSVVPVLTGSWQTAFDIDFTTLSPASYTSNGNVTIGGQSFELQNMVNADSVSVSSAGLVIDPNGNSSDWFTSVYTSPTVMLPITRSIPDFNLHEYQLRLWSVMEVTGSNANYEIAGVGLARYPTPMVGGGFRYFISNNKGYSSVNGGNFAETALLYKSTNTPAASSFNNNFYMLNWKGLLSAQSYACEDSVSKTFDEIKSNLRLVGFQSYLESSAVNPYTTHYVTGSGDLAIMMSAKTVNTSNSFQATWRRLRLDYRRTT